MLYDPSTETVEEILKGAAGLLLDVNSTVASSKYLLPWFKSAWRFMANEFTMHSLDEIEKVVELVVPAGATSFGPDYPTITADFKSSLLNGMSRFEPPIYLSVQGFAQELKPAQSLADFNVANRFVYRLSSSVFYITKLTNDATFKLQFYSKLVPPTTGPIGINYVTDYLMFNTAYIAGMSDGNIGSALSEYKDRANYELQRAISILVSEEGPITPGIQDLDQNDGSRRFVVRSA